MKLYLVDDNETFRSSLKLFLEGHLKYEIIGEAINGKQFLETSGNNADIILMDINMPEIGGLEATQKITWHRRNLKIIAVSQHKESVDVQLLIEKGFKGFVSKKDLFNELEKAIIKVYEGGYYFPDELSTGNHSL